MAQAHKGSDFRMLKELVKTDDRGRVVLGEDLGRRRFQLLRNGDGDLLLRPVVTIPQREAWLYDNTEALGSVRRGLIEAREGQLSKNGPDLKASAKLASGLEDD